MPTGMYTLEIITLLNPILREKAKPVDLAKQNLVSLKELAQNMILTMKAANGVGLAAPQIGQSIRLIVVAYDPAPLILLNPEIISHSLRKNVLEEGCLSIKGKYGLVKRYRSVKMRAYALDGSLLEMKAEGLLAQVLQHEVDHLNGILFIDKAVKVFG